MTESFKLEKHEAVREKLESGGGKNAFEKGKD